MDSAGAKRWYFEFGFLAAQADFVHAQTVYELPSSPDNTRIFLRGSGLTVGVGYRPDKGPWFYQLNYEMAYYEKLEIVGEVRNLHPIDVERALNASYFVNTVVITVGLDVFGR